MRDIRLWELLREKEALSDALHDELCVLLIELAARPLEERVPFLGLLEPHLNSAYSPLVRAALVALGGASGAKAFEWIVAGLDAEDSDTALSALDSLRASVEHEPARWIHGLFHPSPVIRQQALTLSSGIATDWYRLHLLCDEANAIGAQEQLPKKIPLEAVTTIVELVAMGAMQTRDARELLSALPQTALCRYLYRKSNRTFDAARQLLTLAVDAGQLSAELSEFDTLDLLEAVITFFWELSAETQAFHRALIHTADTENFAHLVAAAIVAVGYKNGEFSTVAAGTCCVVYPQGLAFEWIPHRTRRAGLEAVYAAQRVLQLEQPQVDTLLGMPIVYIDGSEKLDLWVLGALLRFSGKQGFAVALDKFGIDLLADSFVREPEASASFFALANTPQEARQLIDAIAIRAPTAVARSLAMLALVVQNTKQLSFIDSLDVDALAALTQVAMEIESIEVIRVKDKVINRLVKKLTPKLLEHGAEYALSTLLNAADYCVGRLGTALLTGIANAIPIDTFVRYVLNLALQTRLGLLNVIEASCPYFPVLLEYRLSSEWQNDSDETTRVWANAHQKQSVLGAQTSLAQSEAKQVSTAAASKIAACTDIELFNDLVTLVPHPSSGLTSALAKRTGSVTPNSQVCITLLACHDPYSDVATQFTRFVDDNAKFHTEIERVMVTRWRGNKKLPLFGNAWLHLWESHCFTAFEQLLAYPGGIAAALQFVTTLNAPILAEQVFRALSRMGAILRFRDKQRMQDIVTDELLRALVDVLPVSSVGVPAASFLRDVYHAGVAEELLNRHRGDVVAQLADLSQAVRDCLSDWIDTRGLATSTGRQQRLDRQSLSDILASIRTLDDPALLEPRCGSQYVEVVLEATLRLTELGRDGQACLCRLIEQEFHTPKTIPHAHLLTTAVAEWQDTELRERLRKLLFSDLGAPQMRYALAVGFLEGKPPHAEQDNLWEVVQHTLVAKSNDYWFEARQWQRLLELGASPDWLARVAAPSPHPHAYLKAVAWLSAQDDQQLDCANAHALKAFLRSDSERMLSSRVSAAHWLAVRGDDIGFPVLIQALFDKSAKSLLEGLQPLATSAPDTVTSTLNAALAVGAKVVPERVLLELLETVKAEQLRESAYVEFLQGCCNLSTQQTVVARLGRSAAGTSRVTKLAESFAWGVRLGLELTGRLFRVVMQGGNELGYTRLDENRIYITPLPILKGESHGEDIVRGLILHEYGHHMYHTGDGAKAVWSQADEAGLYQLLNLVSDEHLERNLRAMDASFGDRLKRLCAFAFQHSQKAIDIESFIVQLRASAFATLTSIKLQPGKHPGTVVIDNGHLLQALERSGSSFARFMRALRMGLGDRHGDLKVSAALSLFKGGFRNCDMQRLYHITQQLQAIFGAEIELLKTLDEHQILEPDSDGIQVFGEGLSNEELEQQIQRILGDDKKSENSKSPTARSLNIGREEYFTPITTIESVPFDPAQYTQLAEQVAPHARSMRRYLERLGLAYRNVSFRTRGHRLDRGRLLSNLLKSDPRMMISRRLEVQSDLFLGLMIDCSGSMSHRDNIEKAKLFATLLAEATKDLSGVDMHAFGFTDSVIYDAGPASRCAAHALEVDGGNNDAAALWHVAGLAQASKRRAKLLIMVSDGLPTECSVTALRALVQRLTKRHRLVCAQVAVEPLEVVCFPHYVLLENQQDLGASSKKFGEVVSKLVAAALSAS